jgi:hypothetical protein
VDDILALPAMEMRTRCALGRVVVCDIVITALMAVPAVSYKVGQVLDERAEWHVDLNAMLIV